MTETRTETRFNRILLTGAAGGLGRVLRERLKPWCKALRLSDIADLGAAQPGEELVQCDLADTHAVDALLQGVDALVHMGGVCSSLARKGSELSLGT